MTNPGKETAARIRALLAGMPDRVRVAVAAAAAERVLPIITQYIESPLPEEAIRAAWSFAEGGDFDAAAARQCLTAYDAVIDELYERGDTDYVLTATMAPCYALRAVFDSSYAERAIFEASDAAETDSPRPTGDRHIEEELEWQLRAAELASNWARPEADRTMFAELPTKSTWLEEFRSRRTFSR